MTRAEMRRAARGKEKAKVTYNFTQEQLDNYVKREVEKELVFQRQRDRLWLDENAKQAVEEEFAKVEERVKNDATIYAMKMTILLPLELLIDKYWTKSAAKRCPGFVNDLLERIAEVQDGKRDLKESERKVWEYGGVRFEEGE